MEFIGGLLVDDIRSRLQAMGGMRKKRQALVGLLDKLKREIHRIEKNQPDIATDIESVLQELLQCCGQIEQPKRGPVGVIIRFGTANKLKTQLDNCHERLEALLIGYSVAQNNTIQDQNAKQEQLLEQILQQMQKDNADDAKEDLQEFKKAVEEGKSDPIIGNELKSLDAMIRDMGDDGDVQHQLNQSFSNLHRKLVNISTIVLENQNIEQATIKENEIEIDEDQILGSGGFGQVLLGRYKGSLLVACKRVQQINSMESFKMQDDLRREAMVWKNLDHKNIVKLLGTCIFNHQLVLVMERCDLPLDHFIHERQHALTFLEMETTMRGMARGMSYLHSKNIIHRDIKPMNVLLSHNLGKVKLTDFGLATIKREYASYAQTAAAPKGTWLYMAPEILDDEAAKWTTRADVYSFAVVCWEMLHRRLPWDGKMDQLKAYKRLFQNGERPKFAEDVPVTPWMRSMIESAWCQNICQRPTAGELVKLIESKSTQRRSTTIVQGLFGNGTKFKRFSWKMKKKQTPEQIEPHVGTAEERAKQEMQPDAERVKDTEIAKREAEKADLEVQQAKTLAEEKHQRYQQLKLAEEKAKALLEEQEQALRIAEEKGQYENDLRTNARLQHALQRDLQKLEKIKTPHTTLLFIMEKYPYDVDIQAKGLKKIDDLARVNQENKVILMHMDADSRIIDAMRFHRQNGDVQKHACGALWSLATNNPDKDILMFRNAGQQIIHAMQLHRQNGELQKLACGALWCLSVGKTGDKYVEELTENGACEEIVKAMQLHRQNGDVQHQACGALKQFVLPLTEMGAVEEIIKAMQLHRQNVDVQQQACGVLCRLASFDGARDLLMKMGACEEIIKAMQLHRQNGDVQREACGALRNFAFFKEIKVPLMKMGAGEEVIKAMQLHRQNGDIQYHACALLRNLAEKNNNNKAKLMKMGADKEARAALRIHKSNQDVQMEGRDLLKKLRDF